MSEKLAVKNTMEEKLCPMVFGSSIVGERTCLRDLCAWWHYPTNGCAIVALTHLVEVIK